MWGMVCFVRFVLSCVSSSASRFVGLDVRMLTMWLSFTVGLSRQHTADPPRLAAGTTRPEEGAGNAEMDGLQMSKTATQTNYTDGEELENQETVKSGAPFTADELATAMSRSTIKAEQR